MRMARSLHGERPPKTTRVANEAVLNGTDAFGAGLDPEPLAT
jgi:hypothetical protein